MLHKIGDDIEKVNEVLEIPLSKETVEPCITDYIEKSRAIQLLSESEKDDYKKKLTEYYASQISALGMGATKWNKIYDESKKTYKSWDIYAISVCYLQMFKDLGLETYVAEEKGNFLNNFQELLKKIITSLPTERMSGEELMKELKNNMSVAPEEEVKNLSRALREDVANEDKLDKRRKLVGDSKIKTKQEKEELLKRRNNAM